MLRSVATPRSTGACAPWRHVDGVWHDAFAKPCGDTHSNTHSDDPDGSSNFVTVSGTDHDHFLSHPNPHHDK